MDGYLTKNEMKEIVFATNNLHKLEEARRMAGDSFVIKGLSDIGCHDDIPETGATLEENAFQKARWVAERYGYACFADDTGLMVDALGGEPGVYTARYAGSACDPDANMNLLLERLRGCADRSARFTTVIAFKDGDREYAFTGTAEGSIALERHGTEGFGYDPVFISADSGKCFAEMGPDEKNAVSHRGRALALFTEFLKKYDNTKEI